MDLIPCLIFFFAEKKTDTNFILFMLLSFCYKFSDDFEEIFQVLNT